MLTSHIESFSWPAEITCTIITEKIILPNHYSIRIGVEPNYSESTDVNLGLKKVKYFINILYEMERTQTASRQGLLFWM